MDLQKLIQDAPWLINPQWSPITENKSLATLRNAFQRFFKQRTGNDINLTEFSTPTKRPDFVLSSQDTVIQMVEIKQPTHKFDHNDLDRLIPYVDQMTAFLDDASNNEFKQFFNSFHITLVADGVRLKGTSAHAFNDLVNSKKLTRIGWEVFLARTKLMHQEFLAEAEHQKRNAVQE
jgi:hypothetical protein